MSDPIETERFRESEQTMSKPKIIIASSDRISRTRMARALTHEGYTVETAGSAAYLMAALLHGGQPVVVLADRLTEGLALPALVALLKSCNPRATIILAADDVPLQEEIRVRRKGIFYRTNRPDCDTGWDELQQAVVCACHRVQLETAQARCY